LILFNKIRPSLLKWSAGDNLFAGFNAALGIEGIDGCDALVNPNYRQLTGAWGIETQKGWGWRFIIRGQTGEYKTPLRSFKR
jgi:hypothetical protein